MPYRNEYFPLRRHRSLDERIIDFGGRLLGAAFNGALTFVVAATVMVIVVRFCVVVGLWGAVL